MNIKKVIYERLFTTIARDRKNRRKWFDKYLKDNKISEEEIELQQKTKFEYNPKISIVVPLYNTDERYLKELIDSINNQTYTNIELCLADGSDKKIEYIEKYLNNKIKYKYLNGNQGIVGNTNEALKLAEGEYIAFMDHDDILKLDAIYEVVKTINSNLDAEFIYTDDDKILDTSKKEIEPQFKPDFSLDMLYSNNYICHLSVFKKEIIDKIGLLNSKYEGAQDYDYTLRAIENIQDKTKIIHIPKILYNWRISDNSVAYKADAKPYAYENGEKALKDHFDRRNIEVEVKQNKLPGFYKIKYINNQKEKVSIIIKDKFTKKELEKCIDKIKKSTYKNYEILILEKLNFEEESSIVEKATGDYIVFLDSDVEVKENTIEEMVSIFKREEVSVVGAKIITKNKKIYQTGITINELGKVLNIYEGEYITQPGYMARLLINQNVVITSNKIYTIRKKDYIKYIEKEDDDNIRHMILCLKSYKDNRLNVYVADAEAFLIKKDKKNTNVNKKTLEMWKKYVGKQDPYINANYNI